MDAVTKKILYISYDGMTDQLGQSQVIPYLAELTKAGYRFHILSVEKKERLKEKGEIIRPLLDRSGIKWTTLLFSRRPPFFSKLYDQWKLNKTAVRICREEKIDMLHCRSYVPAAAGLKALEKTGTPFLFDMRGFWVDERVDSGLWRLSNPLYSYLYKLYKKKEKKYFAASSHIISLTHKGKEELAAAYHVDEKKVSVIPCCADLDHFDYNRISAEQTGKTKQQLGISPGTKVLSYLGSLGGWYMTNEMIDFFKVLQQQIPDSVFLFITHDNREEVLRRAEQRGVSKEKIRVQPAARNEVPALLSVSSWNIFFIKDAYSKKASSPTKQGEVMAMGIPVICNDIGDTGKIVSTSASGFLVKEFTAKEYERVCGLLAGFPVTRQEIRKSSYRYFDLAHGASVYQQVYKAILQQ